MRVRDKNSVQIALLAAWPVPVCPSLSPCALPIPQGKPTLDTERLGAVWLTVCSAGTRTQLRGALEGTHRGKAHAASTECLPCNPASSQGQRRRTEWHRLAGHLCALVPGNPRVLEIFIPARAVASLHGGQASGWSVLLEQRVRHAHPASTAPPHTASRMCGHSSVATAAHQKSDNGQGADRIVEEALRVVPRALLLGIIDRRWRPLRPFRRTVLHQGAQRSIQRDRVSGGRASQQPVRSTTVPRSHR